MASQQNPDYMRGSLDLMVLSVLDGEPKYGYLIQQSLREASRGLIDVQAGTLYPLLHRLEGEKLIRSRWEQATGRRRKWYELTASGRRQLAEQAKEWDAFAACLRRMLSPVLKRLRIADCGLQA
jgi:transcriptional regulator